MTQTQSTSKKRLVAYDTSLVTPYALVVGDPARATEVSRMLKNPKEIWNRREFRAFVGEYGGQAVTVCSHGVGASGAAMIFEVLFQGGVRTMIRAGTCGALVPGHPIGTLLVGTGAVRLEGVSKSILPIEFPAVADYQVVQALRDAARRIAHGPVHTGLIVTSALYFPSEFVAAPDLQAWHRMGVVGAEMEFAVMLIQAAVHQVRAGGIFTADNNNVDDPEMWNINPDTNVIKESKQAMLQIALEALAAL